MLRAPLLVGLILLLAPTSALAACKEAVGVDSLWRQMDAADTALKQLDAGKLGEIADGFDGLIECLGDPVSPEVAARLHRQQGLFAMAKNERTRAEAAFAAARSIQSYYEFPENLVPADNPIREAYYALSVDDTARNPIPPVKDGTIRLDGEIVTDRAASLPTLFQRIDLTGKVVSTAYLWPADPLPPYPQPKPSDRAGVAAEEDSPKKSSGGGSGSTLGSLVTGTSGALIGVGLALVAAGWLDSIAEICDDSPGSGFGVTQQGYCNGAVRSRVGIGYAFTLAGAAGLTSSMVLNISQENAFIGLRRQF